MMPLYDYKNKETGEIEEHMVSMSEAEQFLIDNPHLERKIGPVSFSQRVNMHSKMNSGWKEVLTKAKNAHPLGTIDV